MPKSWETGVSYLDELTADSAVGHFSAGPASGIMAAGLAANSPIWSCQWTSAVSLAMIRDIQLTAADDTVAFAAGSALFQLFFARPYTVADTGGAAVVLTGNNAKRRTGGVNPVRPGAEQTSLFADMRVATTATLTPGTRTLDTSALGSVVTSIVGVAAGNLLLVPVDLWGEASETKYFPLILQANEGLVLQATVPATGTWRFALKVDWQEVKIN